MDFDYIYKKVISEGFYIQKDLIAKEEYQKARIESKDFFNKNINKLNELPKALRGNVGAGMRDILGYSSTKNWKIYRACYFPWNQIEATLINTISLSRKLSMIRNEINGFKNDIGTLINPNGYIQYTSLSLYPKDGGFLHRHFDAHSKDSKFKLIHFKVELTHKSKDYDEGGFYIWNNSGEMIDVSSLAKPRDVIFFNGENYHEIKPIKGKEGRIALFEIPTYVNQRSREIDYTGDGESKLIKLKRKIKSFVNL